MEEKKRHEKTQTYLNKIPSSLVVPVAWISQYRAVSANKESTSRSLANKSKNCSKRKKQLQNLARGGRVDILVLDLYAEAEVTAAIEKIAALPLL